MNPLWADFGQQWQRPVLGVARKAPDEAATQHAEYLPGWRNSNDFRVFEKTLRRERRLHPFCRRPPALCGPEGTTLTCPTGFLPWRPTGAAGIPALPATQGEQTVEPPACPDARLGRRSPIPGCRSTSILGGRAACIRFKDLPKIGERVQKIRRQGHPAGGLEPGVRIGNLPAYPRTPVWELFEELKEAIRQIGRWASSSSYSPSLCGPISPMRTLRTCTRAGHRTPTRNYYVYKRLPVHDPCPSSPTSIPAAYPHVLWG